jgi:outer membrane protein TolC
VLQSYAGFLPSATTSVYAGHSFVGPSEGVFVDSQGRPIDQSGFSYESYNFSLSGGLTLFDWGTNLKRLNQSKHSSTAAGHDLQYQKDFITAVVIREYYDLVKQKRLTEVENENVKAASRTLEQVEAFYKIGSRTKADFLQARVNFANAELARLNVQNAAALAVTRLASRLNRPLETDLQIDESPDMTPMDVNLETEVQYMMEHRSDLLGSRSRISAAKDGVKAASSDRLPEITGFFNYGWNDRAWPDQNNFFKNDYSWSVGVTLNYDIFDRFQTKSVLLNARAQERIAEYNLQQSKINAVLDVKQIVLNLSQAQERLELSQETVTHAKENLRLADERYRVGAGTILETIDASASLTEAQASLIEAQIDFLVYRADLQRATGRKVTTR